MSAYYTLESGEKIERIAIKISDLQRIMNENSPVLSDLIMVLPAVYHEPIEKFQELLDNSKSTEEYEFYNSVMYYRERLDYLRKMWSRIRKLENELKNYIELWIDNSSFFLIKRLQVA